MNEFKETQKFNHWWLWILILGVACLWVYGLYQQLYLGEPFGSNPMSDTGLLVSTLLPVGLILFFLSLTLQTTINAGGIYIRYFPMWSTHIPWDEIEKAELITYGFVGYGIRLSFNYGIVYNAGGDIGLQIVRKNGKKILLGTQRPHELKRVVESYF